MCGKTSRATKTISSALMLLLLQAIVSTDAQRPSYAGSRPTGGLNQKDKYHTTTAQANVAGTTNSPGSVSATQANSNSIPFGSVQRPPVGWTVVQPQQQYVPLNANQGGAPQFALDNRIGGNDIGGGNGGINGGGAAGNAGASFGPFGGQAGFRPQPQPVAPLPVHAGALPLDAQGDQALIDYLNTVPVDHRPFWFLNYQAIEAQRNSTNPKFTGAVGSRGSFFG